MSYGRVEINLLPMELRPGPVVRYAVLISFALIAGAIAFISVDSVVSLARLAMLRSSIKTLTEQTEKRAQVEADYNSLIDIQTQISRYGQIIGLASARYADMPVVLDRISQLLPEGVYIDSVTNNRSASATVNANVMTTLATSRPDPRLIQQALEAFKRDQILSNCYLSRVAFGPQVMDQFLKSINVTWRMSGAIYEEPPKPGQYEFDIRVDLDAPLAISGLPVVSDASKYFAEFKVPELEQQGQPTDTGEGDAAAGGKAIKQGTTVTEGTTASQGMATVDVDKEQK